MILLEVWEGSRRLLPARSCSFRRPGLTGQGRSRLMFGVRQHGSPRGERSDTTKTELKATAEKSRHADCGDPIKWQY
jgi:hypothetical protein